MERPFLCKATRPADRVQEKSPAGRDTRFGRNAKKWLIAVLMPLLGLAAAQAQDVNIPDANFKGCLLAHPGINTNGDGEIQVSEAEAYSGEIYCQSKGIADATGIEAFVNVTSIVLGFNNLTSLDISNNTGLSRLVVNTNKLTALNVSNCPDLKELQCQQNQLTALDVSNNTKLIILTCSFNNPLSALDVSNCPDLEKLYCSQNKMSVLDVTNNTKLINLFCDQSKIAALDLSNCPDLEVLHCYQNQLTSLDLSNNPKLKTLSCGKNKLTALNVKNGNNTNLSFTYDGFKYNPELCCIQVDDKAYSDANWGGQKDPQASYSEDCSTYTKTDPEFDQVGPVCPNAEPSLPNTSKNGIKGGWTLSQDNGTSRDYTFAPDPGQCAREAQMTVEVLAATPAPAATAKQAFCAGTTLADLEATGTDIKWYTAAGGGSPLDLTTALGDNKDYYASQTVGGCESTARTKVSVRVISVSPGSISNSSPTTICKDGNVRMKNDAYAASNVVNGLGHWYYLHWQQSTDGGATWADVLPVSDGHWHDYTAPKVSEDTKFRRAARQSIGDTECWAYSNEIDVQINWVDPGEVAGTQGICPGEVPPLKLTSVTNGTGAGTISYEWRHNHNPSSSYDFMDGHDEELQPHASRNEGHRYRRTTYSKLGNLSCWAVSNELLMVLHNLHHGGTIGSDHAVCLGETAEELTSLAPADPKTGHAYLFGMVPDVTYQWEHSTDNGTTWDDIPGATDLTHAPGAVSQTTKFRRRAISTILGHECYAYSNTVNVTANLVSAGTLQKDQTICSGANAALIDSRNYDHGHSTQIHWAYAEHYFWEISTNGTDWSIIPTKNGTNYQPGTRTVDTWVRRGRLSTVLDVTCTHRSDPVKITINTIAPGAISASQTICHGEVPAVLVSDAAATGLATPTYEWRWSVNNGTSYMNIDGATAETYAHGALTQNALFWRRATSTVLSGGKFVNCSAETDKVGITVTVHPAPTVALAHQAFCPGATVGDLKATGDDIQWYETASGGSPLDPATALVNGKSYYASQTVGGCESTARTAVAASVIIISPGAIQVEKTAVCQGGTAKINEDTPGSANVWGGDPWGTNVSYRWEYSQDGGDTWKDGNVQTHYYHALGFKENTTFRRWARKTLNGVSCDAVSAEVSVQVQRIDPGVIDASTNNVRELPICGYHRAVESATIISTRPGTGDGDITYRWERGNYIPHFSSTSLGSGEEPDFVLWNTDTDCWRRITISTFDGNICEAASDTVKVVHNHNGGNPGKVSIDQTICSGDAPVKFISTENANLQGALTYLWQKYEDGDTQWRDILGAEEASYQHGSMTKSTQFQRVAVSTMHGYKCYHGTWRERWGMVTVLTADAGEIHGDQIVCAGIAAMNLDSKNGKNGTSGGMYFWEKSPTGDPNGTDWAVMMGENQRWLSPGVLTADTYFRRGITKTQDGVSCTGYSNVARIQINNVDGGKIAENQTICEGEAPKLFTSVTAASADHGTREYQWRSSTSPTGGWAILSNTNVEEYASPSADERYYKRVAYFSTMVNGAPVVCSAESNVLRVSLNEVTSAGSITGAQTVCPNEPLATLANSTTANGRPGADITYRWEASTDNWTTATNLGAHLKAGSYTPAPVATTTQFRRVAIATYDGASCEKPSTPVTVTVNDLHPGGITADQVVCEGVTPATIKNDYDAYGDGTITGYTWEYSTNAGTSWTEISGATGLIHTPTAPITAKTLYRRVAYSNFNGKDCQNASDPVTVELDKPLGGKIGVAEATICQGSAPAELASDISGSGLGTISYRWASGTDGTSWTDITGETGPTYQPGALLEQTHFRRTTVSTQDDGSECTAESNILTVNVTVVPAPAGEAILRDCNNAAGRTLAYADPYYGPSLKWYDAPAGGTELDKNSTPLVDGTLYYAAQTVDGCPSTRLAVTYQQDIAFDPGAIATDHVICYPKGQPAAFTSAADASYTEGNISYQWYMAGIDGVDKELVGATAEGYAKPKIALDDANDLHGGYQNRYYRLATLEVDGGYTCQGGDQDAVTIKINHLDPGAIGGGGTICKGLDANLMDNLLGKLASVKPAESKTNDQAPAYRWEYATDGGTTWAEAIGNTKNDEELASAATIQHLIGTGAIDPDAITPAAPVFVHFRRMAISDMSHIDPAMCLNDTPSNTLFVRVRPSGWCKIIPEKKVEELDDPAKKNGMADADELLTYTLTIKSTFDYKDVGLKITDTIPVGTTLVSGSVNPMGAESSFIDANGKPRTLITWDPVAIAKADPGSFKATVLQYKVRVEKDLTDLDSVRNWVVATELPTDAMPNPDQKDWANLPTNRFTAYELLKSVTDASTDNKARETEELTYTVTVKNRGSVKLTGITVSDAIPAGTTYASNSADHGGTLNGDKVEWTVDLPVEQGSGEGELVLTFKVRVADDLADFAQISNIARADTAASKPAVIPTDRKTGIKLTKHANGTNKYALGEKIKYTITVENTGNVSLTGIAVTDDNADGKVLGVVAKLAPGESKPLTAYHTVTQADVDDGVVHNQAVATYTDLNGSAVTVESQDDPADLCTACTPKPGYTAVETDQGSGAGMSLTKEADRSKTYKLGDVITYTITVKNSGTLTLKNVVVSDDNADATPTSSTTANPIPDLAPGDAHIFTAKHTVKPADVEAGKVDNLATAKGKDPKGIDVEGESKDPTCPTCPKTTVPVQQNPGMKVEKKEVSSHPYTLGSVVKYEITVTNSGDVTLTNIVVTDPNAVITSGSPIASLAPNASAVVMAEHTVTQDDVDAGKVNNLATALGQDPKGKNLEEVSVDPNCSSCPETTVPVEQKKGMKVEKKVLSSGPYTLGSIIEYEIKVTNTGTVTLTDFLVTDDKADAPDNSWTIAKLKPGDAPHTITGVKHSVTQDDVDAGKVDNLATVSAKDPNGNDVKEDSVDPDCPTCPETTVPIDQNPGAALKLEKKVADPKPKYELGDFIAYTITVTNTGNLTLTNIIVTDDKADAPDNSWTIAELKPGDAPHTITGVKHKVTQADVDAGELVNLVTTTGVAPNGKAVTDEATATVLVDQKQGTAIAMTKTATGGSGPYNLGETIAYEIKVKNSGSLTLTDITVTDDKADEANPWSVPDLKPGDTHTITASRAVVLADVDAGKVVNLASVKAKAPNGDAVTDEATVTVTVAQHPGLKVEKKVTSGAGPYALGSTIEYEIKVTSTGDVTQTNIPVTDNNADAPNNNWTIASLAPGDAPYVITGVQHKVTQADVDTGSVYNLATATYKDPNGKDVTEDSVDPTCPTCPDPETTAPIDQGNGPDMAVEKKVISGSGPYSLGDVIEYEIKVTNSGTLTLTDIEVSDPKADGQNSWTIGTLAPADAPYTITGVKHKVTPSDVEAGRVDNLVSATGKFPNNGNITKESVDPAPCADCKPAPDCPNCTSVPVRQHPGMTVHKTVTSSGPYKLGSVVRYEIKVENTGDVTLKDVEISDPKADLPNVWPIGTLKPGDAPYTITGVKHTVTQDDVDAGTFTNTALATGKDPNGDEVSEESTATIPIDQGNGAKMYVEKKVVGNGPYSLGDVIEYEIKVVNSGDLTLKDVEVSDPNADGDNTWAIGTLVSDASETIKAYHKVTQDDVEVGKVDNLAKVSGKKPDGNPITEDSVDPNCPSCPKTSVPVQQHPGMTVHKTVTSSGPYKLGSVVRYDIWVKNSGDVTLTDVEISDPKADLPNSWLIGTLKPDEAKTVKAEHIVTQDDVDAGKVDNLATAKGKDVTEDSVDPTCPICPETTAPVEQKKGMKVEKKVVSSGPYALGSTIEYTITVENTGTVTLTDFVVTDDKADAPNNSWAIASLAPGDAPYTITGVKHTVMQDDVDAGKVDNLATVSAKDPNGDPVTEESVDPDCPTCPETTVPIAPHPAMTVEKKALNHRPYAFGEKIPYAITVTNTGDVTLMGIVVEDPNADAPNTWIIDKLAPSKPETLTAHHTVTLADVEAGKVDNRVSVTAQAPNGNTLTEESTATVPIEQHPGMTVEKKVVSSGPYKLGSVVRYNITVTNSGDVTLTDLELSDPKADLPNSWAIGTLKPGESETVKTKHTVTEEDVEAGKVDNLASAVGEDPNGDPVTEDSVDPNCPTCPETSVDVEQHPGMTVEKKVVSKGSYRIGSVVGYEISVTNSGDVTLTDLELSDPNADAPNRWTIGTLKPGQSQTIIGVRHTVTQDDVEAGKVDNLATATGEGPNGDPVTEDSVDPDCPTCPETSIDVEQKPDLTVEKRVLGSGPYALGSSIKYEISVTNSGDVTLTDVELSDPNAEAPNAWTIGPLAPGESQFITGVKHVVTQDDVDEGKVVNIATATGKDPKNNAISDASEVATTTDQGNGADMTVTKFVAEEERAYALGERIEYTIVVKNTGALTLRNIKVTDTKADNPNVGTVWKLAPGADSTLTAWHTVTEKDLEIGYVLNVALARGDQPDGTEISRESNDPGGRGADPKDPNCPNCTVTGVWTPIEAVDDQFAIARRESAISGSVLANDLFDGRSVNPARIVLTPLEPEHPDMSMEPDATIRVPASVRPGRYTYPYRICEVANPNNCSQAVATIEVLPDYGRLRIPNIFTPNGDGVNDTFEILGVDTYDRVELEIVNKWGNRLYASDDYRNDWDGGDLMDATYLYIIKLHSGGDSRTIKGWVTLMRGFYSY